MENNPLVSILINNYNYGRFLGSAIDSALNQTYTNIEVIVVDDGSTDDSYEVLESYKERIISVKKENGGQASAFNIGFEKSKGDIICFLDADDLYHEHKVNSIVNTFNQNPEYGWLIHRMDHIDNQGKPIRIAEHNESEFLLKKSGDYTEQAKKAKTNFILPATSALVFKRELLMGIFPVPNELRITADNYLKFASLMFSPVFVLNEVLSMQRIHGENLYTNINRKSKEFKRKSREINYHIALGLADLNIKQSQSFRLMLGVIKSAIKDLDFQQLNRAVLKLPELMKIWSR